MLLEGGRLAMVDGLDMEPEHGAWLYDVFCHIAHT